MKTIRTIAGRKAPRQEGAVLILGVVLLLVMTLLALTASNSALMQEKIAGNFRDSSLAFHATEAGGRWGAAWLQSLGASSGQSRPFACSGQCTSSASSAVWANGQYEKDFNWSANGWTYGQDPTDAVVVKGYDADKVQSEFMVESPPKFVLEEQFFEADDLASEPNRGVVYYRIIARGTGQRANTTREVSTLLAKRFR